jgi:hypothetical protein
MNEARELLQSHYLACAQRVQKLAMSLAKNQSLFPIDSNRIGQLSDEQEESIDAHILRYAQCVSMIQEQLFRGIALAEQENIDEKSNRDKALLMEKFGTIKSAEAFGTAVMLRNKFSHHYPDESASQANRLNQLMPESQYLLETFNDIRHYLMKKNLIK